MVGKICRRAQENEDEIPLSLNVALDQKLPNWIKNSQTAILPSNLREKSSEGPNSSEGERSSLMVCHLLPITYCRLLQK